MKNYKIIFSIDARENLKNIYRHIADESHSPKIAYDYTQKLRNSCNNLKSFPIRGHSREDIRPNLRIFTLDKKTVAAFQVNEEKMEVTVLSIFYGGQDYDSILRD